MARKPLPKAESEPGESGWVGEAWREHLNGASIQGLADKHGRSWACVRDNLQKYAANRAAEIGKGIDPTAAYIEGLRGDLEDANELIGQCRQDTAKIGALKLRTEIRKLIAAAQGVVTERKGVEHAGAVGLDFGLLSPDEQVVCARHLAKASNGKAESIPDGLRAVADDPEGSA